jgi:hypothetical protein
VAQGVPIDFEIKEVGTSMAAFAPQGFQTISPQRSPLCEAVWWDPENIDAVTVVTGSSFLFRLLSLLS